MTCTPGRCEYTEVPVGDYTVTVVGPDGAEVTRSVTVEAGATVIVDVKLSR